MKSALLVALAVLLLQGGQSGGVRAHHTKAEISTQIRDYNGVTDKGGGNVGNIKCLIARFYLMKVMSLSHMVGLKLLI